MSALARAGAALGRAALEGERLAAGALALLVEAEDSTSSYRSRAYARARASYARQVANLERLARRSDLDPALIAGRFRDVYQVAVDRAATVALARAGTTASSATFGIIDREVTAETARFERFVRDLRAAGPDATAAGAARADLYVAHLDGVQNRIWADASSGPGVLWWWEMGSKAHCDDCVLLHLESPFEERPPATPRDGSTKCLGNCGCTLTRTTGGREPGEE